MENRFTVEKIDKRTYVISEYHHIEETHCYLISGERRALLIDTGLGVYNIRKEAEALTDKNITAVATHVHWDHIGGHKYFPDFYVHEAEASWLCGDFPLSVKAVRDMLDEGCLLSEGYDLDSYEIFCGTRQGFFRTVRE